MTILALDTAMSACSVALWRNDDVCARRFARMERGHAEAVMPMVRQVLDDAETHFPDIDLFAVTMGPGTFTGLRIGLAAARGMALATDRPCLGVTTLEAVAHGVPQGERAVGTVLVVLGTKRDDVYAQGFTADLRPLGLPRALIAADLAELVPKAPVLVAGDAAEVGGVALAGLGACVRLSRAPGTPDAATVAAIAATRWAPGQVVEPPAPLYLRPPAVTLS